MQKAKRGSENRRNNRNRWDVVEGKKRSNRIFVGFTDCSRFIPIQRHEKMIKKKNAHSHADTFIHFQFPALFLHHSHSHLNNRIEFNKFTDKWGNKQLLLLIHFLFDNLFVCWCAFFPIPKTFPLLYGLSVVRMSVVCVCNNFQFNNFID